MQKKSLKTDYEILCMCTFKAMHAACMNKNYKFIVCPVGCGLKIKIFHYYATFLSIFIVSL